MLGSSTSGIELLDANGHPRLIRTQSESAILYSNQSTSTSELNIDQSQASITSGRPRSYSEGTVHQTIENTCKCLKSSCPEMLQSSSKTVLNTTTVFSPKNDNNSENLPTLDEENENEDDNDDISDTNSQVFYFKNDNSVQNCDTSTSKTKSNLNSKEQNTESNTIVSNDKDAKLSNQENNTEFKLSESVYSTPQKSVTNNESSPSTSEYSLSPAPNELSTLLDSMLDESITEILNSPTSTSDYEFVHIEKIE